MNDHTNALPAGYRLGEYEIQTVLGSGGFGVTYRAHDHNLDKEVAIKEYLPSDVAVRDGRAAVKPKSASQDNYAWGLSRFLYEARTLARFDHPHINKVHRFFKENGTAYLVLEYVDGDTLSNLLTNKGRFNEADILRMLNELLDGLEAVHNAGYIHRDIKPANIIVRRDGSAVLLDFGAARQADGQTVTVVFTACYAPVEQHFGKSDALGASSDLYSLGVVAYRCLLGGNESVLMDARERAHWINEGKAEKDMSSAVVVGKDNYSAGLLRAIDWAMKVDANDRPQSVGEMRVALSDGVKVKTDEGWLGSMQDSVKPELTKNVAQAAAKRQIAEKIFDGLTRLVALLYRAVGLVVWLAFVAFFAGASVSAGVILFVFVLDPSFWFVTTRAKIMVLSSSILLLANLFLVRIASHAKKSGNTLLHYAARKNAVSTAKISMAIGSAIGANGRVDASVRNKDGWTPMHYAASENAVDVAKLLVANGADINAKNKGSATPLHYAAWKNSAGAAKLLVVNGADVNAKNKNSATPLHWAAYGNAVDTAKLLVANGMDVNAKDHLDSTPLHWAAVQNAADVVKLLIANGADVNAKSNTDTTPLHSATVRKEAIDVVKLLLANGADINAVNNNGWTPLSRAQDEGHTEMVTLLKQHGAQ